MSNQHVSDSTIKRLVKEVSNIFKNPLTDEGIYYIHDDNNMLKGYALIIGPEDTPYEYGNYLFEFKFPSEYPQKPPKVIFHTTDGNTRFHPNLYVSGKVCLSILNTWFGDSWTSCQTIRSILLTIVSILTEKSLLNEPGIKESHYDINNYDTYIKYKNYKCAIYEMLTKKSLPNNFSSIFYKYIKEEYIKNKDKIIEKLNQYSHDVRSRYIDINFYKMRTLIDYKDLYNKFEELDLELIE